jgi:hypothetical protein
VLGEGALRRCVAVWAGLGGGGGGELAQAAADAHHRGVICQHFVVGDGL